MAVYSIVVCGCSGKRSCLQCEKKNSWKKNSDNLREDRAIAFWYNYCTTCSRTYCKGAKCSHTDISEKNQFPVLGGIHVIENFVNKEEESLIVAKIDENEWKVSQSGRLKQDYGPQVNFKKKKLKLGGFNGLPAFSKLIIERIWNSDLPILSDFQPVELCNLDYNPARGSSIDPHIDDTWLWGERLITLNLLSPTVLTFTQDTIEIAVPMPNRSLIVVSGPARHYWKHAIKRQDISARRIAITLRELSNEFGKGSSHEIGSSILKQALSFQGTTVCFNLKNSLKHRSNMAQV